MIKPSRGLSSIICVVSAFCATLDMTAQTVVDELREDVRRAAGMRYAMTLEKSPHDTPPPGGKKPFYINHCGSPSVYYLDRPDYYDAPFAILSKADSLGKLTALGQRVLQPLACLLGINGYDLQTTDLDEIEKRGWSASAFPMGGNVQFVFYRSSPADRDVLFKVLLNEQEATLPIRTDCAPYYHWKDFRRYCLRKLRQYEKKRKQ